MQEVGVLCPYQLRTGKLLTGQVRSTDIPSPNAEEWTMQCAPSHPHPLTFVAFVLSTTQVGYVVAGMRSTRQAQVGDTIFHHQAKDSAVMPEPLPGFEKARSMLFAR